MSKITQPRVKQIRQKSSSGYLSGIPIGADGLYIDMSSGFDLEEELKLGGNHYVEILDSETSTVIREWYYTEGQGNRTREEMSNLNLIAYSVETMISKFLDERIETASGNEEFIITQSQTDDPIYIVNRQEIEGDQSIVITLYEGDMMSSQPKALHQKIVIIKENEDTSSATESATLTVIKEEVDG